MKRRPCLSEKSVLSAGMMRDVRFIVSSAICPAKIARILESFHRISSA
jgi:hypothetical protein